jgi:hypothetical protein
VATELATCGISIVDELYDILEGGSGSGDKREINMTLTK